VQTSPEPSVPDSIAYEAQEARLAAAGAAAAPRPDRPAASEDDAREPAKKSEDADAAKR
jgi:hypothetical protein